MSNFHNSYCAFGIKATAESLSDWPGRPDRSPDGYQDGGNAQNKISDYLE
ncbi:MAG: hypothetical protein AAF934_05355 [Bacteroidota bacterium]